MSEVSIFWKQKIIFGTLTCMHSQVEQEEEEEELSCFDQSERNFAFRRTIMSI